MDLYSIFIVVPHTQGAQVQITQCYLQITPYLPLPRKHSSDGASPDWGCGHLIAAYYSFIYPKRMKGWVGLVGWPKADGLPTYVVTHQLQVERRTAKVRLSETNVLPQCHATNRFTTTSCIYPCVRGSSHCVVRFLWLTKYTRPVLSIRLSKHIKQLNSCTWRKQPTATHTWKRSLGW